MAASVSGQESIKNTAFEVKKRIINDNLIDQISDCDASFDGSWQKMLLFK